MVVLIIINIIQGKHFPIRPSFEFYIAENMLCTNAISSNCNFSVITFW